MIIQLSKMKFSLKYPKYLSDQQLFEYQIKEPFFRKTVLTQLKFFLYNLDHPVKCYGKTFPPLKEDEKKLIKHCEEILAHLLKLFKLPNSKKSLNEVVTRSLQNEQAWMTWKDTNCANFDKYLDKTTKSAFQDYAPLP